MGQAGYWQCLTQGRGDGTTLTGASAASMLPSTNRNKFTIPPQYWTEGRTWRITATGRISSLITTPGTARFDLRLGSVVVWDSQAILLDSVAAHSNVGWYLEILLHCRTIASGVNSNLFGQGKWTCEDILGVPATAPKGVLTAILPWNAAPAVGTSFDNSLTTNTVDMFFTQTVATGSMTLHQYMIEECDMSF